MALYVHCNLFRPDYHPRRTEKHTKALLTPSAAAANAMGAGDGEYDILCISCVKACVLCVLPYTAYIMSLSHHAPLQVLAPPTLS